MVDLRTILPERETLSEIFDQHPSITHTADIFSYDIGPTPTTIDATFLDETFLDEGAGYKNAVGYYMWVPHPTTSAHQLLTNDPLTNSDGSVGHYTPTIIFPNASLANGGRLRRGGHMYPGHKRILFGNNLDGTFSNVRVGFFVLSNGWNGSSAGVANKISLLHSEPVLNARSQNEILANEHIQTIIFDYEGDSLLAFEDIQRPGGDSDFNDLVMKVTMDPPSGQTFVSTVRGTVGQQQQKRFFWILFVGRERHPHIRS